MHEISLGRETEGTYFLELLCIICIIVLATPDFSRLDTLTMPPSWNHIRLQTGAPAGYSMHD